MVVRPAFNAMARFWPARGSPWMYTRSSTRSEGTSLRLFWAADPSPSATTSPMPSLLARNSTSSIRQKRARGWVRRTGMLSGDRSLARRAACSGVTRCPAGTASPALLTVIGRSSSPTFAGRKKFPVYVAPGSRRIVSPGRAAFSARCKSPPPGTVTVDADGSPDTRKRTSAVRNSESCLMRESSGKADARSRWESVLLRSTA